MLDHVANLIERWDLTFALLDDTRTWRERAVHEIVLRDSDHVRAALTYQLRLPLDVVQRFAPEVRSGENVRLLLPFTVRPKELLLDVGLRGSTGEPVGMLLRYEAALIQAAYLSRVLGEPPGATHGLDALWTGIASYTPSSWAEHLARAGCVHPASVPHRHRTALVAYLRADLDLPITEQDVDRWLVALEGTRDTLVRALGEEADLTSASECMLLAIPFMPMRPGDIDSIDLLVDEFVAAVERANPDGRAVLAEYGRRWELIVDAVVPVDRVCSMKLTEQRPWVGAPSATLTQEIAFADATTTHVEIRAADHGIVVIDPTISDLAGERVGYAVGDAMRETADAVAIYAADPDRPYFARISVGVRVRASQRAQLGLLVVLILVAAVVAAALPRGPNLVDGIGVLTVPLTLAGAVVLTREATPLAERLLQRWRLALAGGMGLLWLVAMARLLSNGVAA